MIGNKVIVVSTDERTEAELRAPGHTSLLPSWLYPLDQGLLSLWRPYAGFLPFIFSAVSFPDTPSSLGFRSSVPGTTSLPCSRTVPASPPPQRGTQPRGSCTERFIFHRGGPVHSHAQSCEASWTPGLSPAYPLDVSTSPQPQAV